MAKVDEKRRGGGARSHGRRVRASVVELAAIRTPSVPAPPVTNLLSLSSIVVTRLLEVEWAVELSAPLLAMMVLSGLGIASASPELYALVARDSRLHEVPPERARRTQLGALLGLAPVTDVSLWLGLPNGRLRCLEHLGANTPTRRTRQAAFDVLHGIPPRSTGKRICIHAAPVVVHGSTRAALVVRSTARHESVASYVQVGAEALAPTLGRQVLLDRLAAQQGLLEAAERRVTRVGLDLHDGPLQHMSLLMAEIADLRRQVGVYEERLRDQAEAARSIDEHLRQLIAGLPAASARRGLEAMLRRQIRVFARGCDIPVRFTVRGAAWPTSQSQRIALAHVVQEALANVRLHSGAAAVEASLTYGRAAVTLRIADDGRGFDTDAQRGERLGLVAMAERIQLLDGAFDIESRPGGPTVVSAVLPRFELDAGGSPLEKALREEHS